MLIALLLAASTVTPPIPLDAASRAFQEVRIASAEDAGRLWGVPLDGPLIFVDPATRFAVANQQDAVGRLTESAGVFIGTIPPDVILANTAMEWAGTRWTMVLWPSVAGRSVPRRHLLFHEAWHRIQPLIGFIVNDKPVAGLESVEGRYWLRLELRALASALRHDGEAGKLALQDALVFRTRRRTLLPTITDAERLLESNEGLAEYTGIALRGTSGLESRHALSRTLDTLDPETAFARSFAYYTGPAYGLLLDETSPGWTRRFRPTDHLGAVIVAATGLVIRADEADARAARYGAAELLAFERKRHAERQELNARNRTLYVEGPTVELPMANATFGFDPTRVMPLEGVGSIHPTLDVRADWGTLAASAGALITEDFSRILLPASDSFDPGATPLRTEGWILTLAPGWSVMQSQRPGSWRVAPTSSQSQPQ